LPVLSSRCWMDDFLRLIRVLDSRKRSRWQTKGTRWDWGKRDWITTTLDFWRRSRNDILWWLSFFSFFFSPSLPILIHSFAATDQNIAMRTMKAEVTWDWRQTMHTWCSITRFWLYLFPLFLLINICYLKVIYSLFSLLNLAITTNLQETLRS